MRQASQLTEAGTRFPNVLKRFEVDTEALAQLETAYNKLMSTIRTRVAEASAQGRLEGTDLTVFPPASPTDNVRDELRRRLASVRVIGTKAQSEAIFADMVDQAIELSWLSPNVLTVALPTSDGSLPNKVAIKDTAKTLGLTDAEQAVIQAYLEAKHGAGRLGITHGDREGNWRVATDHLKKAIGNFHGALSDTGETPEA